MNQRNSVGAIILAAGTASRMGKPKQLLRLKNKAILEHVIDYTLNESFTEIMTVIGHEAFQIQRTITVDDVRFSWVVNEQYLSGQSSSLRLGINSLQKHHTHIMVFLGDLPFITSQTIRTVHDTGLELSNHVTEFFNVRPVYQGTYGHPVFFGNIDRNFFKQIKGDKGAKSVMGNISIQKKVDVDDCGIVLDIDTPNDYAKAIEFLDRENEF